MLQKLLSLGSRGVIVPSPSAAVAAHRLAWFPNRKIHIIPNGVDFSKVVERPPGIMCPPHIGFIGRLDPIKCIPTLIDALTYLSEGVHLHIFGDGPDRQRIENHIAATHRSYQVTLHGMVDNPWEALSQIDILVLPSQAEGFGMVLIEAMAAGVNVVGTRVPGITDIIHHETNGPTGQLEQPPKPRRPNPPSHQRPRPRPPPRPNRPTRIPPKIRLGPNHPTIRNPHPAILAHFHITRSTVIPTAGRNLAEI